MSLFKIQKFDFLVAVYIACLVIAELMGGKTFPLVNLFGYQLNSSVAIFLFPLLFTINDIITEVYGKERTRSIIRSGLLMVALVFICSIFFTSLPPSARFAPNNDAYTTVFGLSARISAASLIAFAIAEFTDVVVFVKIRRALGKKALWLRNNASNFIAQFADTTIFMTLAFYSFTQDFSSNFAFLTSLIIPYWLLKCFMSIIETPLVYVGVKWLQTEKK